MQLLITGGTGYIGSHATLAMLLAGFDVIVLDNLCNSSTRSLSRVMKLAGRAPKFIEGDIRDSAILNRLFAQHSIKAVLHFAGLKAVGESMKEPLSYYDNNVSGTVTLCKAMINAGVFKLLFSSSATVYGKPTQLPITEEHPIGNTANPYGLSKYMAERVLGDLIASDSRWKVGVLRYFNPVGAHESGQIGEDPEDIPNNLIPYIAQVALGKLPELKVFGSDYPTVDGTGVRDYIHVADLAEGHVAALKTLLNPQTAPGMHTWNLGTGQGYSVLQIVKAYESASGVAIPYSFVPRRPGDIAACYADTKKALRELGWIAKRDLDSMMRDAWRWQLMNPNGYN